MSSPHPPGHATGWSTRSEPALCGRRYVFEERASFFDVGRKVDLVIHDREAGDLGAALGDLECQQHEWKWLVVGPTLHGFGQRKLKQPSLFFCSARPSQLLQGTKTLSDRGEGSALYLFSVHLRVDMRLDSALSGLWDGTAKGAPTVLVTRPGAYCAASGSRQDPRCPV